MAEEGYVNYYEVLGVVENVTPGEVRKTYKRKMKNLVNEIARSEITNERRSHFLLEMAQLNAALVIMRDKDLRQRYWDERCALQQLEEDWREAAENGQDETDGLRRQFEAKMRDFLSSYVDEAMLEAGRDQECVESSHWDEAHERHAAAILRHHRHRLYHDVLERLPYYEVTKPEIDWDERARIVSNLLSARAS